MNAIALNSMAFNSMRIVGPGLAGVMIELFGPEINFLLQAIMYGAVVLLVLPYRAEYADSREGRKQQSPLADLREGIVYVAQQPILRYAILLSMIPTLTMMAFIQTQMPVFVARDLDYAGRRTAGSDVPRHGSRRVHRVGVRGAVPRGASTRDGCR